MRFTRADHHRHPGDGAAPVHHRLGRDRAAATPAGAPRSSVELEIGDCVISGETSGIQDDALTVVHRDPGGALRASHTFDVSGGGWLVECPGPRVRAGDRIPAAAGGGDTVRFRTFIVPDLSIRTARAFDRIRGTAPRVSSVDLELSLCDVAHFGCTTFTENDIPVNTTTRRWSFTSGENLQWRIVRDRALGEGAGPGVAIPAVRAADRVAQFRHGHGDRTGQWPAGDGVAAAGRAVRVGEPTYQGQCGVPWGAQAQRRSGEGAQGRRAGIDHRGRRRAHRARHRHRVHGDRAGGSVPQEPADDGPGQVAQRRDALRAPHHDRWRRRLVGAGHCRQRQPGGGVVRDARR